MDLLKERQSGIVNLEKIGENKFISTSNDPQIYYTFDKPLMYGWFKVKCKIAVSSPNDKFYAKLFFDFGEGLSEKNSTDICLNNGEESVFYIKLNNDCRLIRLDPHENMPSGITITIFYFELQSQNRNNVFFKEVIKRGGFIKGTKTALKAVEIDLKKLKKNLKEQVVNYVELPKAETESRKQLFDNIFEKMTFFSRNQSDYFQPKREFKVFNTSLKAIALYLPQFHPISENDKNWGKGFTEWTNVTKAYPHFEGHYQPHLPADLGFYNLSNKEAIGEQIQIAKLYGIHGFCIYNYWFDGVKVLEKPLEVIYENKDLDIPFMLCWANENWTKRWDGLDEHVLLRQNHSEESDARYLMSVLKYLKDPRYIRIDNKPVLLVYKPTLFPNFKATTEQWRKLAISNGLPGLYLMAVKGFGCEDPTEFGLDALYEFPPATAAGHIEMDHKDKENMKMYNTDFVGKIYDYRKVANNLKNRIYDKYTVYKGLMLAWDNTARVNSKGHIFHFSNPDVYQEWLFDIAKYTSLKFKEENQFIFINAWNEWAEGTHLEPDRHYGYSYLDKTAQVLEYFPKKKNQEPVLKNDIGFCIHVYYYDLWDEIQKRLKNISFEFQLFMSITEGKKGECENLKKKILKQYPSANIRIVKNKGRDVLPFIEFIDDIIKSGCKYLCKIHTKKSIHRTDGDKWRSDLYNKLIGDDGVVKMISNYFIHYPQIGIIGPQGHLLNTKNYWGYNRKLVHKLAKQLDYDIDEEFHFVAGTMFWIRTDILKSLKKLNLKESDFEDEENMSNIKDGTLSHAIERIFSICSTVNNKCVIDTRVFHGHLGTDFKSIKRYDPNNYDFAMPIVVDK